MSNDANQSRILQRLQRSTIGLSSRDIARSVKLKPSDVSRILLELQKQGLAERSGGRWRAKHGSVGPMVVSSPHSQLDSQTSRLEQKGSRTRDPVLRSHSTTSTHGGVAAPEAAYELRMPPQKQIVDPKTSSWGTFRQLCKYYAECVRLDQKATIHAKAEEEFSKIVCIGGGVTNARSFNIQTLPSWHQWMKNLQKEQFVFLG